MARDTVAVDVVLFAIAVTDLARLSGPFSQPRQLVPVARRAVAMRFRWMAVFDRFPMA